MVCSLHSVTTGSRDRANVRKIINNKIIIYQVVEWGMTVSARIPPQHCISSYRYTNRRVLRVNSNMMNRDIEREILHPSCKIVVVHSFTECKDNFFLPRWGY